MRSGCRNFVLQLGTSVASALLIAVGTILLIFGISSSTPSSGIRVTLLILAAAIVAYAFLRIGRDILQDLKNGQSPENEKETEADKASKKTEAD